jgi:cytochrome P450
MTTIAADVPVVRVTFLEDGFNADPYPQLRAFRELGPVVYNEANKRYMATRYRDCTIVLGNTRMFDAHGSHERVERLFGGQTMETVDDAERHDAMRGIWADDFRRGSLDRHEPLIRRSVDTLLGPVVERLRSGETVDVVTDLTRGIPTLVIAGLMGIDASMFLQFSAWSDAMGAQLEATLDESERTRRLVAEGTAATRELNAYVASVLAERRAHPGDDLISTMVTAHYAMTGMPEQSIVASITQLVFAGNETTSGMMATAIATLAEHPGQRRDITADSDLIPQAFEEIHRFRSLSQGGAQRYANSDSSVVGGVTIPRHAEVMPLVGLANRDPGRWENPDVFDIYRQRKAHLGFGFGMHSCLGLNLARYEVQIFLQRLLEELPDYELAADVEWGRNFLARKPARVLVRAGL